MSIKLKIEGQVVEVDKRFADVSELFNDLLKQSGENEVHELSSNYVTQNGFDFIRKYYEHNNFNPTIIEKSSDNPDVLFVNAHDKELIMAVDPFNGDQLLKLLTLASYLKFHAFRRLCLARIMIEFHFDKNEPHQSMHKLQKKYQDVPPLTLADIERYKKLYPELINEFK